MVVVLALGDASMSEHLHKLAVVKSEEQLESLLQLLWQTRKTGLSASQKSSLQSLLELPSPGDLEPVLPSIRLLIRKCVRSDFEGDDISKLLPPDLPLELQSMLLTLFQKHWSQWKGELSQEQHVSGQSRTSCQNAIFSAAPVSYFPASEGSGSLLSQQVNPFSQFSTHNLGGPIPVVSERNGVCLHQLTPQNDAVPPEFLEVLPRVKSMTWTVENNSTTQASRVAIITLKLQVDSKSPSKEREVKFQLTKDTLEAVLRSMAYINEQLSRHVGSGSCSEEPPHKKQKQ